MHEVLIDRLIIEVSGSDVLKFLQNLTTNDLGLSDYCYTYMLNHQGRYLFDFFVFKESPQKFLIDIHKDHADLFKAKLILYKLRSNIQIVNLDHYKILYSREKPKCLSINSIIDPRFGKLGFRSIIENINTDNLNFTKDLYLEDKYNYAIPDGYSDLIADRSIPVEYGAEELGAINYNKGCYMGQEVISRIKYQGKIRKKY
jgi:folate-binding protein YgfZ